MYEFLAVLLLLLIVPVVRYFIWRQRFKQITENLKTLGSQFASLKEEVARLAGQFNELGAQVPSAKAQPTQAVTLARSPAEQLAKPEAEPLAAAVEWQLHETKPEAPSLEVQPPSPTEAEIAVPVEEPRQKAPPIEPSQAEMPRIADVQVQPRRRRAGKLAASLARLLTGGKDRAVDWEILVGGHWLNLIGIVVLVVGVVLLTQQTLLYLGPAGKIATGFAAGIVLLVSGIVLGRASTYRLLGRTLMGGGWALIYFTAYAAHNVDAARIIQSPILGLGLLCAAAAGIIAHSFTYRSQVLTSLAYGLGFMAVTLSPVTVYSLAASAILAASLIAVIRLLPWHHLVMVGVAGTYLNHWRWISGVEGIRSTSEGTAITVQLPEGFWLSTLILAFYWLLFVAASLARRPVSSEERGVHFTATVVNTVGMLGLMAWQFQQYQYGELYYLTAMASVAYCAVAYLDRRLNERRLFLFNATIAAALFAASLPLAEADLSINRDWRALYWGLGAIVVLVAGVRSGEILLRVQAYLLLALASVAAWQFNLAGEFTSRAPALWAVVPIVILLLVAVEDWLQRVRQATPGANELSWVMALVAVAVLARLIWQLVEPGEAGTAWLLTGVMLLEVGLWWRRPLVRTQGYVLTVLGSGCLLILNLLESPIIEGKPLSHLALANWQLVLIAIIAAYYWAWRLTQVADQLTPIERKGSWLPSAIAGTLAAFLIFRQADWPLLAVAWAGFGLTLFILGRQCSIPYLRFESYLVMTASLFAAVAIHILELALPSAGYGLPRWAFATLAATGLGYTYWAGPGQRPAKPEAAAALERSVIEAASYGATLLAGLILWNELPSVAVAVAWTGMSLILFEVAAGYGLTSLRWQAHLLIIGSFARVFMANFVVFGEALGLSHRLLTVSTVIAAIYYLRLRMLETLPEPAGAKSSWLVMRGRSYAASLYSYAAAVLIVVLIRFEFGRAFAVVGWAGAMLFFLWLGLGRKNFDFRAQSYLLAIIAFARTASTSVFLLGSFYGVPERLAAALPVIAALLVATFMSPRNTEPKPAASNLIGRWVKFAEYHARAMFAVMAAALVPLVIYYQVAIDYVSMAWALAALIMLIFGFATKERPFRLSGLALLFATLVKVVLIDLADVEAIYRILSFIVLGAILLLTSLGYTRYRQTLERYI